MVLKFLIEVTITDDGTVHTSTLIAEASLFNSIPMDADVLPMLNELLVQHCRANYNNASETDSVSNDEAMNNIQIVAPSEGTDAEDNDDLTMTASQPDESASQPEVITNSDSEDSCLASLCDYDDESKVCKRKDLTTGHLKHQLKLLEEHHANNCQNASLKLEFKPSAYTSNKTTAYTSNKTTAYTSIKCKICKIIIKKKGYESSYQLYCLLCNTNTQERRDFVLGIWTVSRSINTEIQGNKLVFSRKNKFIEASDVQQRKRFRSSNSNSGDYEESLYGANINSPRPEERVNFEEKIITADSDDEDCLKKVMKSKVLYINQLHNQLLLLEGDHAKICLTASLIFQFKNLGTYENTVVKCRTCKEKLKTAGKDSDSQMYHLLSSVKSWERKAFVLGNCKVNNEEVPDMTPSPEWPIEGEEESAMLQEHVTECDELSIKSNDGQFIQSDEVEDSDVEPYEKRSCFESDEQSTDTEMSSAETEDESHERSFDSDETELVSDCDEQPTDSDSEFEMSSAESKEESEVGIDSPQKRNIRKELLQNRITERIRNAMQKPISKPKIPRKKTIKVPNEIILTEALKLKIKDILKIVGTIQRNKDLVRRLRLGQVGSVEWLRNKKYRLDASFFGSVCKRNENTSCMALLKEIINYNQKGRVSASALLGPIDHANTRVQIALDKCADGKDFSIENTGLFVKNECMSDSNEVGAGLCAIATGLNTNENALVLHKFVCVPDDTLLAEAAENMQFCVKKVLHHNNCSLFKMREDHNYYFELQGLLNIAGFDLGYFILDIGDHHSITLIKVKCDRYFYENTMVPKLTKFYLQQLLPEFARKENELE